MEKKTLIIGASTKPERYSYLLAQRLNNNNIPMELLGARKGEIFDVEIKDSPEPINDIHTISMYINPKLQEAYREYIVSLKPKRVIFNPGTENTDFADYLESKGVQVEENCSLVMMSLGHY